MLSIKPRSWCKCNEELGPVSVWACVCHGQEEAFRVSNLEVFIFKLESVDGLATSTISTCEVAALSHKAVDDSMEVRSLKSQFLARSLSSSFLTRAQASEILNCLWNGVTEKAKNNFSLGFPVNFDIKEDFI